MLGKSAHTEFAVIGESIAGLYAALMLARRGREVTLFERAERHEPSDRTLIVTPKFLDLLGDLGESAVLNRVDRFEMKAGRTRSSIELAHPDLIIERSALIRGLTKAAVDSGVEVIRGCRFHSVRGGAQGLSLSMRMGREEKSNVSARILIGADGSQSRVAQASGLKLHPTAPLLQAVVEMPGRMRSNVSRIWFRTRETPYFYWFVPDSASQGVLGVIGRKAAGLRSHLDALAAEEGFRVLGYQGAQIPIYRRKLPNRKKLDGGEVFLVGDAAGHVKVSTVGGVVTGIRGAIACVESICGERTGATASLRAELALHVLVRKALHRFSDHDYSRLLGVLNSSSTEVLSQITRDEMPQLLWRLAVAQPGLLGRGLRSILPSKGF